MPGVKNAGFLIPIRVGNQTLRALPTEMKRIFEPVFPKPLNSIQLEENRGNVTDNVGENPLVIFNAGMS